MLLKNNIIILKILFCALVFSFSINSFFIFLLLKKSKDNKYLDNVILIDERKIGIYEARFDFSNGNKRLFTSHKIIKNQNTSPQKSNITLNGLPIWYVYFIDEEFDKKYLEVFLESYNKEMNTMVNLRNAVGVSPLPTPDDKVK